MVADHSNAISAARKAFVEAESSNKLKRALARRVRPATSLIYEVGDKCITKEDSQISGEAHAASSVKKNIRFLLNMVAYMCVLMPVI